MNTTKLKTYDLFGAMDRLRDNADELSAEVRRRLKTQVALNASDRQAVSLYVDLEGDDWANIYPPLPKARPISTGAAIDTFLNLYGNSSPEEEALLERLIFNPVPEYSGVLEQQEKDDGIENQEIANDLSGLAKIINSAKAHDTNHADADSKDPDGETENTVPDSKEMEEKVSRRHTPPSFKPAQRPVENMGNGSLSFELAKIFVKQGHFRRAHEIISSIILNNPEKSVYFADQLRFLEKLIKIQEAKGK